MANSGNYEVTIDQSNENQADIKEWGGNEFSDGATYTIVDSQYRFVCTDPLNRNKVLDSKDVKIDLYGNKLINFLSDNAGQNARISKTYFTVASGSTLSIINTGGDSTASGYPSASTYGFNYSDISNLNSKKIISLAYPSFIVDSGTLNIGNSDSKAHITVSGCPNIVTPADGMYRHAAIDITDKGGTVNLFGGVNPINGVRIQDAVRGISTMDSAIPGTSLAISSGLNININMTNASIITTGTNAMDNYGININGKGKSGRIVINIGGKDPGQSASILSSGSNGSYNNYGIRIVDFKGDIEINIENGSTINAGNNGYGIYIDKDCTGNVKININNTLSITGKVYIKGVENTLSTGTNTY